MKWLVLLFLSATAFGQNGQAVNNGTVKTVTNVYQGSLNSYPGIDLFGDSITYGDGVANPPSGPLSYAALLMQSFGGTGINYGYPGDQAADMNIRIHRTLAPQYTNQPATTLMIGTNDGYNCQSSNTTGCQANYGASLMDSIVWAAVPQQLKILFGTNPFTTFTGNWVFDNTLSTNWALRCTGVPCVMTFTSLVPSKVVYISYVAWANGFSTPQPSATVSCDSGAVTDTLHGYGFNGQTVATTNGNGYTGFTNREVFTAATLHTCTITVTASASTYGFTLISASTPQPSIPNTQTYPYTYPTANGPRVFIGGVIREWVTGGAPDTQNAPYNTIALNTCAQLASDGLPAYCVDTRSAVNNTSDMASTNTGLANNTICIGSTLPTAHPGSCGMQHLADAFNAVARPLTNTSASGRATLAAGTATVLTTAAYATSTYQLTNCGVGGTVGSYSVGTVTPGAGFVLNSSSSSDTSTICWSIK